MTKKISSIGITALLIMVAFATIASAATTVVVTPTDPEGWSEADTRIGGDVNFVVDATSPFPGEALQLATDSSNTAKAQYLHAATTTLAGVTSLSYYNKQVAGPVHAAASYQLIVDLDPASSTTGFTTLVYEPYQNGVVVPGVWQQWDVDAGQFWSSRSYTDGGTCTVVAGAGGAPFYTLSGLQAACPTAVVLGFGVNVGTFNPGYDVYVDGVVFNDTTYDFEIEGPTPPPVPDPKPETKDECKDGGWMTFVNPSFKNQGQCVSSVANGK